MDVVVDKDKLKGDIHLYTEKCSAVDAPLPPCFPSQQCIGGEERTWSNVVPYEENRMPFRTQRY